ncbi:hypothetical protein H6P81_016980 [Aristolochia fimbriata]|uniref:S1 motif domain-containing protein n=1 Tax=Aristolochia fimbriata TaxID=158543 RepID=A0AAV7DY59_ARIFI|nr:hypothetical protein H6P81_016980 [Aristolochia fimbriata]
MISWPAYGSKPAGAMDALTTSSVSRLALPSGKSCVSVRRPCIRVSAASREGPELDKWDQMELKFGRLMGEDPKLTLAKIIGRKSNPDVSYLDIEKEFEKNRGKLNDDNSEVPFDMGEDSRPSSSLKNLQRPTRNTQRDKKLELSRPVMKKGAKSEMIGEAPALAGEETSKSSESMDAKTDMSNVPLRKPTTGQVGDIEMEKTSVLKIKPNLFLKMRKEVNKPIENLGDVTLLTKPQPFKTSNPTQEDLPSEDISYSRLSEDELATGLQPTNQRDEEQLENELPVAVNASLNVKPQRLEPLASEWHDHDEAGWHNMKDERSDNDTSEVKDIGSSALEEQEKDDWSRAENLLRTGQRTDVELISCSTRGFVASLGSLLGFLPYRGLGARWKFLAFESWLRKKGLDPSLYRQSLGILGSHEVQTKRRPPDANSLSGIDQKADGKKTPDTVEELLEEYDKEKTKFLSSFIGQKIKVNVVLADRHARKLMFSVRPREKEEIVEKKRSLMAKLNIGDVVKCVVKKITYFGIFVEVEGVPALIHQSEVSWDATLDPSLYCKVGQIVDAKVHQLDFGLERITLSLKQITPDPLTEALESVVGDHNSLGGSLETAQPEVEWDDVESLMKELKQIEGVTRVSKGRFFLSPGLAPTFQVYMASMFENQYKLLARSGNKVQEVLVQASLDREQMKDAILTCTNRVE